MQIPDPRWSRVGFWRKHGVSAKWGRTRHRAPIMLIQRSDKKKWWALDSSTLNAIIQNLEHASTLQEAVDTALALGDFFSAPL